MTLSFYLFATITYSIMEGGASMGDVLKAILKVIVVTVVLGVIFTIGKGIYNLVRRGS